MFWLVVTWRPISYHKINWDKERSMTDLIMISRSFGPQTTHSNTVWTLHIKLGGIWRSELVISYTFHVWLWLEGHCTENIHCWTSNTWRFSGPGKAMVSPSEYSTWLYLGSSPITLVSTFNTSPSTACCSHSMVATRMCCRDRNGLISIHCNIQLLIVNITHMDECHHEILG